NAAIDHVRDWATGTANGDWVSMGVCSDGSYGIPEGLIAGVPVTTKAGNWSLVDGLDLDDFSRARIDASIAELVDERDAVGELGLLGGRVASFDVKPRHWEQDTPFGRVVVVTSARGLRAIGYPDDDDLPELIGDTEASRDARVAKQLDRWFAGRTRTLDIPLDLDGVDGFKREVLETLVREVGWGETVSYGELAEMPGRPRAARAVGSAIASNPLPVGSPCPQVLAGRRHTGRHG